MKTIAFYGESDDHIEVDGDIPGCDEYDGDEAEFLVAGLQISVTFGDNGCWGITVGQVDEDVPVTAKNLRMSVSDYTMRLELDVPVDSQVEKI